MRLFFALWPDSDTRARLAEAAAHAAAGTTMRISSRRENYHLTLAFVGEVAESQLAVLQQIGARVSGRQRARSNSTRSTIGRTPRVLVAIARETPSACTDLSARLHEPLALNGAPFNQRAWDGRGLAAVARMSRSRGR